MNCSFLTNSLHIDLEGNVFPCTISRYANKGLLGSIKTESLEAIFLRSILHGSKCRSYCNKCTDAQYSFKDWKIESNNYDLLDLRLDNYCNFLCRTCSGYNSIAFKKESPEVKKRDISELIFKNIDFINRFSRIYISGGEPLLSRNTLKFLKLLSNNKQIMLSTNLSMNIPNEHTSELSRFANATFFPSIDGVGEVGKYIRYGFDEDKFFNNLNSLKKDYNIVPVITVNTLNILYLNPVILKLSEYININNIYLNFLEDPIELNITILPQYLKDLVFAKIKNIEGLLDPNFKIDAPYNLYKGIDLLKHMMRQDSGSKFNDILDFLKEKDKIRNQSYKTIFPFL